MRNLALNEVNEVAGGLVGDMTTYYFDLLPNREVIGFDAVCVGYDTVTWTEKGFWEDHTYTYDTPVMEYWPIYAPLYI